MNLIVNRSYRKYIFEDNHRYIVMLGSAGSGKSYATAQKIILKVLQNNNRRVLCIRKIFRTVRESQYRDLVSVINKMGAGHLFQINDLRITCKVTGSVIIFSGLDDVDKLKSISGVTDVWIEEADQITLDDYLQIKLRLRGVPSNQNPQIIMTLNPTNHTHFINSMYYLKKDVQASTYKTTYKDNMFLEDEYIKTLEDLKDQDPLKYQVYCLGEWGVRTEKLVFNQSKIWFRELDQNLSNYDNIVIGADFGFNHASCVLLIGFKDEHIFVLKEVYKKGLTNSEFIDAVVKAGIPNDRQFIADCAEPDRIKEFVQKGFKKAIGSVKGASSVSDGFDYLKGRHIWIDKSCPNTLSEIQQLEYKVTKDGQILDEVQGVHDDAIAALRYAVEPIRRYVSRKIRIAPRIYVWFLFLLSGLLNIITYL